MSCMMFLKSFSDFIIAKDVTVSLCRFVDLFFLDFNARNEFPEGIIDLLTITKKKCITLLKN